MEIIKVALRSLHANRLRSSLTILGIVVGIFSIISISTVIAMLQSSIEEGVSALGQNVFQIQKWPAVQTGGNWAEFRNRKDITIEDYYGLKEKLVEAQSVGAEQWRGGRLLKYGNVETNPNVSVCGCTQEAFPNNDWIVETGRALNNNDEQRFERVIVLGSDVAEKLFAHTEPIGQEIKVDGYKLKVIGVLESKGGGAFGRNQGNDCMIPITTWQNMYGKRENSVNITVKVESKEVYNDIMEKAEGYMRTIRKVPAGKPNDFDIYSNESILSQINNITSGVRIGAMVIGLIALLAAGVGIMNIMLVSVTERTKEIGIRKAIGAKKSNILIQFLMEAVILSLIGGIAGIILGVAVGNYAGSLLEAAAVIPMDWVLVGVLLCVIIGITFGTYPAFKAANLDPIEALRYE